MRYIHHKCGFELTISTPYLTFRILFQHKNVISGVGISLYDKMFPWQYYLYNGNPDTWKNCLYIEVGPRFDPWSVCWKHFNEYKQYYYNKTWFCSVRFWNHNAWPHNSVWCGLQVGIDFNRWYPAYAWQIGPFWQDTLVMWYQLKWYLDDCLPGNIWQQMVLTKMKHSSFRPFGTVSLMKSPEHVATIVCTVIGCFIYSLPLM